MPNSVFLLKKINNDKEEKKLYNEKAILQIRLYKRRLKMKVSKRILALLMAILMMSLLFAACGKEKDDGKTKEEKVWVIASDNAFAPFEYLDTDSNKYVGIDMDIIAAIAEDQGFKYKIDNVGFKAACSAVQTGQADAAIAGMTITDERKETFDFTDGYFNDGQILVTAKDSTVAKLEDLKGTKVAVKSSTMGAKYAEEAAKKYGFEIQYYEDSPTMYTAVKNGNNSACFEDYSVMGWAIKTDENIGLKTVGDVINAAPYGIAVKKGENEELLKMLNEGLKNISENGKLKEILAKYGY